MSTIYRGQFSTLWITLQSNEQLGILDSGYLEDYYGNDGQVTLHHVDTGTDYPVLMTEVVATTPEIPHDVFRGQVDMASLPDGDYQVRGRCCDIVGNYSILSSVETPAGDEVLQIGLEIRAGQGLKYQIDTGAGLARAGFSAGQMAARNVQPAKIARPLFSPTLSAAVR